MFRPEMLSAEPMQPMQPFARWRDLTSQAALLQPAPEDCLWYNTTLDEVALPSFLPFNDTLQKASSWTVPSHDHAALLAAN